MKLKEIPLSIYSENLLKWRSAAILKKHEQKPLPIIVSLTTIPSRIRKVHITIRSVLAQKRKPKKIVLWLPENLKDNIPESLLRLSGDVFEVRYSHLHCSHKKLIHSLKLFPSDVIVTCDDDVIYRQNWLEKLYSTHLKYPEEVIAHRVRCIRYSQDGKLLPYKKWQCVGSYNRKALLPIGAEGVLYPPDTFSDIVYNEELFLKLAPKADDLWFKAVALSNGKLARKADESPKIAIPIAGTQKFSLKKENVDEGKNKKQWEALTNYFELDVK